jgi:hypothetical protein
MPTDTDRFPDGLDTDPVWPPTGLPSTGRGPLQDLRWQRQMRPRWQRISFVSVLAVLFALLFDPSRVLFAGLGLAIAAILWPVLGWPGRIVSWTLADGWTAALVGRLAAHHPLPRPSGYVGDLSSRRLRADGAGLARATPGAGFSVHRGLPGRAGS